MEEKEKLMEKPDENDYKFHGCVKKIMKGSSMHDYVTNSIYDDWCRFHFPNGVKEKIKDKSYYKVWYHYYDASDPMDSSCSYSIQYIEEIPEEIREAVIMSKAYEKMIKEYLEKE